MSDQIADIPPPADIAEDIRRTASAVRVPGAEPASLVEAFAARAVAGVDARNRGEGDAVIEAYSAIVRRLRTEDGRPAEHALCQAYLLWLFLGMVARGSIRPDTARLAAGLARSLPVVVGHLRIAAGAAPDATDDAVAEHVLVPAYIRGENALARHRGHDEWLETLGILTD